MGSISSFGGRSAKRPFNGPQSVIEYLGRYTHLSRWIT